MVGEGSAGLDPETFIDGRDLIFLKTRRESAAVAALVVIAAAVLGGKEEVEVLQLVPEDPNTVLCSASFEWLSKLSLDTLDAFSSLSS